MSANSYTAAQLIEKLGDVNWAGTTYEVPVWLYEALLEHLRAGPESSDRYRAALERIVSGLPAHDDQHGWFVAHFDQNGNEVGIEQVDPSAIIGSIVGVANDALNLPAATERGS